MLTMLGGQRRFCDGVTRRETLKAGSLAMLGGLSLAGWPCSNREYGLVAM